MHYHDSFAYLNGDAGFYVGESPKPNVEIEGNHTYPNQAEGILFRDSLGGEIKDNIVDGNCAGIFLLDTGAPGTGGDVTVEDNHVHDNNAVCPPSDDAPPFSGIGVGDPRRPRHEGRGQRHRAQRRRGSLGYPDRRPDRARHDRRSVGPRR